MHITGVNSTQFCKKRLIFFQNQAKTGKKAKIEVKTQMFDTAIISRD